ncbi:MAG: L-serine ammonia-lyase [Geminicoccaceae bacterium]
MLSVIDIFKVGIGPSSSHTVGPMKIAAEAIRAAAKRDELSSIRELNVDLHSSLALTGAGHGTNKAVILGLPGFDPATVDPDEAEAFVEDVRTRHQLALLDGTLVISFDPRKRIDLRSDILPSVHPNEMRIIAKDADGATLFDETHYSIGGGITASADDMTRQASQPLKDERPLAFQSAKDLLSMCTDRGMSIAEVVLANEDTLRPRAKTMAELDAIWDAMNRCIERGLVMDDILPGGLGVKRRAASFHKKLLDGVGDNESERIMDWLNVYAMAVNEENAAGGRVVTAPTNGAAGIIPAVMRKYCIDGTPEEIQPDRWRTFLLTAAGIGMLYKQRASISGAEMGCQGEVGVACSMAAAGLAAVWDATPFQVERAAEIGMEHNLGLTCDPVKGLVQIPCIERNAIASVKAVNAARLAMRASDNPKVSLDQVIETMRQTGLDMSHKYKETSEGGLAVNVVEC